MHFNCMQLHSQLSVVKQTVCQMSTLCSDNLHVQVSQAAGSGQRQFDHALHGHCIAIQVVEERAVLVVVGNQPQLSPCSIV